ncbi:MAG: hypothetical protein L3J54_11415, partial [Draconibacterium sp.]|nr:hypothetical protein [Draconibacterium sp.]
REFYFSTILVFLFFFGIVYSVPPLKYVIDFGEYLTDSWEEVEQEPPVPHAELFTLIELAEQLGFSTTDEITRKLKLHNIKFSNTNEQTLQEIAHANNTTPIEIYEIFTRKSSMQGGSGAGRGIGRKTIVDLAVEVEETESEVMRILGENGIKVKEGQTLRDIGDSNDISPQDIYKLFEK